MVVQMAQRGDLNGGMVPEVADYLLRAAREEERVEQLAEQDLADDHAFFHSDRVGFMGSERHTPPAPTRAALRAARLDVGAVTRRPQTREERDAEVVASFDDDRTRALGAGFAAIDKVDVHERTKAQMLRRKGY